MEDRIDAFLPELRELEALHPKIQRWGRLREEARVVFRGCDLPIYSYGFGQEDPSLPTLAFVAGVHGLERIGTRVAGAYLKTFCELLEWDELTRGVLERCRVLFYPLVNPGGMMAMARSNPNGVDLMRNAPVDVETPSRWRLFQGHRLSARLPWFRGHSGGAMEVEADALCQFIRRELFPSRVALSVDIHSGFGVVDRLWFPYARSRRPFPRVAEVYRFKELLDRTFPNHVYRMEPQSHQYTTHGDLWDYLFDIHFEQHRDRLFLPFSLEMGSWNWVKKNPRQLLSALGAFNPVLPHRKQRTLRRHLMLFDFMVRATVGASHWAHTLSGSDEEGRNRALEFWFRGTG